MMKNSRKRDVDSSGEEEDDGDYFCGVCDIKYGTDDKIWIECEQCSIWFHLECVKINKQSIPDVFVCFECSA